MLTAYVQDISAQGSIKVFNASYNCAIVLQQEIQNGDWMTLRPT